MINFFKGVFSVWCIVYGSNTHGSKNTVRKQADNTFQER
jgi:hypothetical protein